MAIVAKRRWRIATIRKPARKKVVTLVATSIVKHSISIAGHRTSISLERAFWEALGRLAASRDVPIARLVAEIDAAREDANLSSAIRVYVLEQTIGARPAAS